jgi:hypothetical protein
MVPSSPGAQLHMGERPYFSVTINRRKDTKRPPDVQKTTWNSYIKHGCPRALNHMVRRTRKMKRLRQATGGKDVRPFVEAMPWPAPQDDDEWKPLSAVKEKWRGLLRDRPAPPRINLATDGYYVNTPSPTVTPRHGDPPVKKSRSTQTPPDWLHGVY